MLAFCRLSSEKKHIVFERPYASAAGASEESFSIFCDVYLENAIYKDVPSECFGPFTSRWQISRDVKFLFVQNTKDICEQKFAACARQS